MPNISYDDIVLYLEAIANNPLDKASVDAADHGRFWKGLTRDQFVTGLVPQVDCNGAPIPIVNADPAQCPFYQALVNKTGWCQKSQMPKRGPWITDPGYSVTLAGGVQIAGTDIAANIEWWLRNNMPAKSIAGV